MDTLYIIGYIAAAGLAAIGLYVIGYCFYEQYKNSQQSSSSFVSASYIARPTHTNSQTYNIQSAKRAYIDAHVESDSEDDRAERAELYRQQCAEYERAEQEEKKKQEKKKQEEKKRRDAEEQYARDRAEQENRRFHYNQAVACGGNSDYLYNSSTGRYE